MSADDAAATGRGDAKEASEDRVGGDDESSSFDDDRLLLSSIARTLASCRNVVVLAGAGISVSCGIPDFRSSDGLYATLDCAALGLSCPEDLFDLESFTDDPRPFYKFASTLLHPGTIRPGRSHEFLAYLDARGMLLRAYTQNIDGLEEDAGVKRGRVVYAHGSLRNAACTRCKAKYSAEDIAEDVARGTVPLCDRPRGNKRARLSLSSNEGPACADAEKKPETAAPTSLRRSSRRRSSTAAAAAKSDDAPPSNDGGNSSSEEASMRRRGLCCGVIKPNVTFFGERLGNDVARSLRRDHDRVDALIVMGTSLSVAPMSRVVEYLPRDIPRILVNRNSVRLPRPPKVSNDDGEVRDDDDFQFHACLLGDCDDVVGALREKMEDVGGAATGARDSVAASRDEGWLRGGPKGRVLLFSGHATGAVADEAEKDAASEPVQRLVVHCDECQEEIEGTAYACKSCFDYDLCGTCHPVASLTHADGRHEFAAEG